MGLINKIRKEADSTQGAPSLAVAYNVQKTSGRRSAPKATTEELTPTSLFESDDDYRPNSIADAIMRRKEDTRLAAEVPLEEEAPLEADPSLSQEPEESPDHISQIRERLKAKRGF